MIAPSLFLQLKFKSVVTKIDSQYQCFIFFRGDFIFDEEATVSGLQPEAESKTHVKR